MKKVGLIILTYNRLNLLKITIDKIRLQDYPVDEILIVNNNSTDGTKDYIENLDDVTVLNLNENLGPAGGFYYGIKYFHEKNGFDYLWIMDDDFFPLSSCLGELINNTDEKSIAYPSVRDKEFRTILSAGWYAVLVPINIIDKIGYPIKELFFWAEDVEYLSGRIGKYPEFKQIRITSAKGVHFTKREKGYRSAWRYYYEVRNTIVKHIYLGERTLKRDKKLLVNLFKFYGMIILREDDKIKKLKYCTIGAYHGFTNKLGKRVDPAKGFINYKESN